MSDWPSTKIVGPDLTVSVDHDGHPHWTRLKYCRFQDAITITLSHDEARDLLYAMQRVVAFLDTKK